MAYSQEEINLNVPLTKDYAQNLRWVLAANEPYTAAKIIARDFLGGRKTGENQALFGFWMPGLVDGDLRGREQQITLELFTPLKPLDFPALKRGEARSVRFGRRAIPLQPAGDYLVAVVDAVRLGSRAAAGTFYWLRYDDGKRRHIIRDPLAASTPFGVYAPAELFDAAGMLAGRQDMDYFQNHYREIYPDGSYRARDIGTHLEIHPETATAEGTIAALTRRYREIGRKIQANIDAGREEIYAGLTPAELNFVAFDTIELTPEVPQAEREGAPSPSGEFFQFRDDPSAGEVAVEIKRPDISNWGYDTPILGSAAVNPSILATLRPNEFLDFIETIHTLPGRPIQLCIDSVLGHCDFQGARLLQTFERATPPADQDNLQYINSKYLRGANMYGRDIDFSVPEVKALLLEMLVRKLNYGYDCVRVDGAQDFLKAMDEISGMRIQDDDFLNEMANVVQEINGLTRRLDFNLEDGRPWPDDLNWLYNSKYLDHTIERTLPFGDRVKQWSPIIFAHNVHGKYKWFMNKWDRFVEVYRYGENWITGHSNHDNVRYFYRMTGMRPASEWRPGESFDDFYNDQLGETLPEVAHNALDNNALTALSLGFLPGHPMFMLNALFHTPWTFIRDIDDTYAAKIVSEEGSRYFTWYVSPELYGRDGFYRRLKKLGFRELGELVAPPAEKEEAPAFMDILLDKRLKVKTDALTVRFLFDDPADGGGYPDVAALEARARALVQPRTAAERLERDRLESRLSRDPHDAERHIGTAQKMLQKNRRFLARDLPAAGAEAAASLSAQLAKIDFLQGLNDHALALLIEDADARDAYDLDSWAADPHLAAAAPAAMRTGGRLTAGQLTAFARAFMHDARDAAKVHHYQETIDPARAAYRFRLRRYRQENPWLRHNPTNDVRRDYFARKLYINGAKDLGDWSDTGDVVNCNTIYYGWRTNPAGDRQVFLIANMEGKPLDACPLYLFLNLEGNWTVVTHAPTMTGIPPILDKSYVIHNFKNGEALLLERRLKAVS